MHNHSLSAHPITYFENFQHLSPQASDILINLQKLRNKEARKEDNRKVISLIAEENYQQSSNAKQLCRTQSIVQVSNKPVQNENDATQSLNYSFIQTPNPNKQHINSIKLDDPTPDFKDQPSSSRNRVNDQLIQYNQSQQLQQIQIQQQQQPFQEKTDFQNKTIQQYTQQHQIQCSRSRKENNNLKKNKQILNNMISEKQQIQSYSKQYLPTSSKHLKQSQNCSITSINSSLQRCNSSLLRDNMYQKALMQQEKLKTYVQQEKRQSEVKELKECTFNPKVNSSKISIQTNFFSRLDDWMKKRHDNICSQKEKVKESMIRECTFSPIPNPRQSKITVGHSDVYDRNCKWQNKVNMKKQRQRARNSIAELNYKDIHAYQKQSLKRSNSAQLSKNDDIQVILKTKLKLEIQEKPAKLTAVRQCTETTTSPSSFNRKQCLKKKKSSVEDIDQKYQMLCELIKKVIKSPSTKKQ